MSLTKATYSMIVGAPVNVLDYGADPTGVLNSTDAFVQASAVLTSNKGGTLIIPRGNYLVGKQTFAGAFGLGYAYRRSRIIYIENCTNPILIQGNGATLKCAGGLKFGAFNPVTGSPYASTSPFTDPDYAADVCLMIQLQDNTGPIIVENLTLDGNDIETVGGGPWGDTGIQLTYSGIYCLGNHNVTVKNVYAHNFGLDGFLVGNSGIDNKTLPRPHTLENVVAEYNGRQGLSYIGGNSLLVSNSSFCRTGLGAFSSAPGAGVDIEPESAVCGNSTFINCQFLTNTGPGILAINDTRSYSHSFYNCLSVGSLNWSLWGQAAAMSYYDCRFYGAIINIYGSLTDPNSASKFVGCLLSMDPSLSPSGAVYGTRMDLSGSDNVVLDNCRFDAAGQQLPFSPSTVQYKDCYFQQTSTTLSFTRGTYTGRNIFKPNCNVDFSSSLFFGPTYYNGSLLYTTALPTLNLQLNANDGSITPNFCRIAYYYSPTDWATAVGGARKGDIVYTTNPLSGGYVGSVCTVAGTPGTWRTFGLIS